MSESRTATRSVQIVARSRDLPGFESAAPFAAGYVDGSPDALALVPSDAATGASAEVPADRLLTLHRALPPSLALLVPPLATAMSFWDRLGLELGDAAVYTDGGPLSRLTGQVALWRGGYPVVELGPSAAAQVPDIVRIDWTDAEDAAKRLGEATASRPGFAAVEHSGRAEVLDTLLETMPRWSRLLLASTGGGAVTIDYYKNVHRKGAVVDATVGDAAALFEPHLGGAARAQVPRAIQWMERPALAARCAAALGLLPAGQ
ncbi:MAG: hypothetical protein AB7N65_27935 [Vicinamibacterales bacterium]